MSMMKDFKEFALKGNLVDLAIGVVMGAAFGKVVSAFIDGMVMPAIGMVTSGVDFNNLKLVMKPGVDAVKEGGKEITPAVAEVAIKYGTFITQCIEFLVVALVVFMIIKALAKMKRNEPAPAPAGPSAQEVLLMEIRDALKK